MLTKLFRSWRVVFRSCLIITFAFRLVAQDNEYSLGPDSQFQANVPHGVLTKHTFVAGANSVFPGTARDYWVYVPKQYDGSKPACLMIFQDGGGYVSTNGNWRVPWVFDNLIARGEMPVTLGLFINPGVVPNLATTALPRFNRSYEYDGLGDAYARFLIEEMIPEISKEYLIRPDPDSHAIAGASSGAIAAFTAAWERPDYFRRVFSTIGTYVGLRGGNDYPTLIRKSEPKSLRVFLQDGYRDLNIYGGNWWIANQDMYSALLWAGYEVEKTWGTGGHDGKQGGAIFPEAMKWLWKNYPQPIKPGVSTNNTPIQDVLLPDEDWQLIGQGYQFPAGLSCTTNGDVLFSDLGQNRIYRVNAKGEASIYRDQTSGAQSLAIGPDGTMLASQPDDHRLVAFTGQSSEQILANEVSIKDLVVASDGTTFFTEPSTKSVKCMNRKGTIALLDTGIDFPSALCLSPDQSLLYVADLVGQFVYSFQIQSDGSLAYRQPYFHLHLMDNPRGSGADALCVDDAGRLYVATYLGIQFCDQAGRVNGIIAKPEKDVWATDLSFGGKNRDELYLTAGEKIWKRKLKARGALPYQAPVLPKAPRL